MVVDVSWLLYMILIWLFDSRIQWRRQYPPFVRWFEKLISWQRHDNKHNEKELIHWLMPTARLSLYFIQIPSNMALSPLMITSASPLSTTANSDIRKDRLLFLLVRSSSMMNLLTAFGQFDNQVQSNIKIPILAYCVNWP